MRAPPFQRPYQYTPTERLANLLTVLFASAAVAFWIFFLWVIFYKGFN